MSGGGEVHNQPRTRPRASLSRSVGSRATRSESFTLGEGQQRRIVAIDWDIAPELIEASFTAIFFVEPV